MTPKERVIAALNHEEPDCVPTGENLVDGSLVEQILERPTLYNTGWKEVESLWDGKREELVDDCCRVHVDLAQALEWDYVRVPTVPTDMAYHRPKMVGPHSWIDDEGYEVNFNPDAGNIAVRAHFPDMQIDDLPDPNAPFEVDSSQLEAIRYVVEALGDTHFIIGRSPVDGTLPWGATVGMEEFLTRMITDPEFVQRAIDVYVSRSVVYIQAMLDAGVDAVMTTDDYSDNRGPMMGEERFAKFILPGLVRQCEAVHDGGGYFIKHTDGNVWPFLDRLVEIGIDGWHGIQPDIGMDMRLLKERYGDRLCFFGGVNCETLIEGPPERVREEVRYAIAHAGQGGGLVVTTSNALQPGAQLENYLAMRQAIRDYGRYPIAL
ncbi:MAG: uroporphyrinogen decarboxylase family protein [Candidatus Latescibacteria bacterium]|nr:uroporphyrinogen decarboxylase family protein [Candidatus Latescibacterota bacterium]